MENMAEKRKLSPEELEQVTGGFVVYDPEENQYWVVRQNGTIIAPAPSEEQAVEFAKAFATSPTVLTMEQYKEKYGRDLAW